MGPVVCSAPSAKLEGGSSQAAASQYTADRAAIEAKTPGKTNDAGRSELCKQAHRETKKTSENG